MEDPSHGADRGRTASRRVADELKAAIESGRYPVGTALPPLRQLADQHEVAVNTAMAAVRLLADLGYVANKPNAGSYVLDYTDQADPELTLRRVRAELGELQNQVRQAGDHLTAIDERLSELSGMVARLEGSA